MSRKTLLIWNNPQCLKSSLNKKFVDSLDKNCRMIMSKLQKFQVTALLYCNDHDRVAMNIYGRYNKEIRI